MQGVEGKVLERGKATLIVLEVGLLGQGTALEIDGSLLEPLD
jgi:hypothetical protein